MDRLGAGLTACLDDLVDHQIAFGRLRRPNENGFIRHLDVERITVGFRVHGNRLDTHATRGLDDTAGDFAAICDQDLFEHALFLDLVVSEGGRAGFAERKQFGMGGGL